MIKIKNKKIFIPVIVLAVLVIGFFGFKFIEAENLKRDVSNTKVEITTLSIKEDDLKYLDDKKLITKENQDLVISANKEVLSDKIDNVYLDSLKATKTKLEGLNKQLVTDLTKKVNDTKASQEKSLKAIKVSAKAEKDNATKYSKVLTDLKLGNNISSLVLNLKTLDSSSKDIASLNKIVSDRVAKEEKAKASQEAVASASNGASYNDSYYYGSSSSSSGSYTAPSTKPSKPSNSGGGYNPNDFLGNQEDKGNQYCTTHDGGDSTYCSYY
jgi:hypothetical protein